MSLISQRDRELTIRALEYYSSWVKDAQEKTEYQNLLNWVKLQHAKES
jgi:hypothetical protein